MADGELPEEYRKYREENINWLEQLGDKLTGVDERVDYVVMQLARLKLSEETIAKLVEAVEKLEEMGLATGVKTEHVVIPYTVAPLQDVKLEEDVPLTGKMIAVIPHFPDGCDALVDVAFGHGSEQICPGEGFLALNDATPVLPVSEYVKKNDTVWCYMGNGDAANPHSISVSAIIVGE